VSEAELTEPTKNSEVINPFFEIPIEGSFPKDKIAIQDTQETIERPNEVQEKIEENWLKRRHEVEQRGGRLVDRPKVILLDTQIKADKLYIKLGRGRYKDFVGTYETELHDTNLELVPRNFSISALLETADGYIVLLKRSKRVFQYPSWISTFGGSVEPEDVDDKGNIDPFKTVTREVSEEAGISPESIHDIQCLGFTKDIHTKVEDMMFQAKTLLTKDEIEKQQRNQHLEEGESVMVLANPDEIRRKVLEFSKIFVSDGVAILALYGRRKFGEEWFNFVINHLRRRGSIYASFSEQQRNIIEDRLIERLGRVVSSK